MAQISRRRRENVPGDFYVDDTCIDCDTCRWVAPEVFHENGGQAAVYTQPKTAVESFKALQALIACPTASIGTVEKSKTLRPVIESFPILIDDNVYYCGYAAARSYGAASYFIQRPEGNVLVDSPRYAEPLMRRLERAGGLRYLFLTHRDDVAEHKAIHARFKAARILHADDVTYATHDVEIKIEGEAPFQLAPDFLIIPTPGHTQGHCVLLYKNKFLFTGDHMAYDPDCDRLTAFRDVCWYSWDELRRSMKKLSEYSFEWVLPGHGRRFHATKEAMRQKMAECLKTL